MKKILFFLSVFLLVFLGGLGILLFHREPLQKTGNRKPAITVPQSPRTTPAPRNLPPLRLPPGATAVRCPENSWEYSGEFAANFVSARAQLMAPESAMAAGTVDHAGGKPEAANYFDLFRQRL